jgi:hypothetical protein
LNRLLTIFTPLQNTTPDAGSSSDTGTSINPTNLKREETEEPGQTDVQTATNQRITRSMTYQPVNALLATATTKLLDSALQTAYSHTKKALATPLLRVPHSTIPSSTQGCYVNATAYILAANPSASPLNIEDGIWQQMCYKVVHPNTGEVVEYKHLQTSSEGYL